MCARAARLALLAALIAYALFACIGPGLEPPGDNNSGGRSNVPGGAIDAPTQGMDGGSFGNPDRGPTGAGGAPPSGGDSGEMTPPPPQQGEPQDPDADAGVDPMSPTDSG